MDYAAWTEQIKSGKPGWDWGDFEAYFPIGNPDLFLPLDKESLGVTADDMVDLGNAAANAELYSEKAVGQYISAYVLLYDSKRHPEHPSGWAEVFDQKKWPGIVSMYNYPYGMLEVALVADGVTWDSMYPLDYERAFKKLNSLGKNLVFSNSGAEAQQQLASGAADWVVHWNMRGLPLAQQGLPIAVDWKDNVMIQASHVIPANTDRPKILTQYIANSLKIENQAAMANATATGPVVKGAFELIDEDVKPWVATNPVNIAQSAGLIDDTWWAENFGAAYEKWNAWQASRG
jgi:putative spermidine/putrescine transport system substrate-binding protein